MQDQPCTVALDNNNNHNANYSNNNRNNSSHDNHKQYTADGVILGKVGVCWVG